MLWRHAEIVAPKIWTGLGFQEINSRDLAKNISARRRGQKFLGPDFATRFAKWVAPQNLSRPRFSQQKYNQPRTCLGFIIFARETGLAFGRICSSTNSPAAPARYFGSAKYSCAVQVPSQVKLFTCDSRYAKRPFRVSFCCARDGT